MPTLELVIARYQEDLHWVRRVPKRFKVTIYHKGEPPTMLPPRRPMTVVARPDAGREEYAYLRHILDHYDQLADITVFAQGKPFDHVPSFHKHLHDIAFGRLPVDPFCWLGFIIDEDDTTGSLLFQKWPKNTERHPLPLDAFFRALWDQPAPERVTFYPSAHFAVTAEQVRRRPRVFYEKALQCSATLPHAGHCFERTWDRVFGVNGIPEAYRACPKPVYLRRIRRLA